MERIYNKFKGLNVEYANGVLGVICGYCDNNLLMATKQKPIYAFRDFGKQEKFIEPEFQNMPYRYAYITESFLEKCLQSKT